MRVLLLKLPWIIHVTSKNAKNLAESYRVRRRRRQQPNITAARAIRDMRDKRKPRYSLRQRSFSLLFLFIVHCQPYFPSFILICVNMKRVPFKSKICLSQIDCSAGKWPRSLVPLCAFHLHLFYSLYEFLNRDVSLVTVATCC